MTEATEQPGRLPPNWFIKIAWAVHRAIVRFTGGRRGIWRATPEKWGTVRLHTVGRKSGKERIAILGYYEDGANLVTLAMNGWMEGEPAWWLNLKAQPDATIEMVGGTRAIHAREAVGEERDRLWGMFHDAQKFVERRSTHTAVVVLEPKPGA